MDYLYSYCKKNSRLLSVYQRYLPYRRFHCVVLISSNRTPLQTSFHVDFDASAQVIC